MKASEFIDESSGYIPKNEKEAHDPRYVMAITPDVKPGEDRRQAAKLNFKLKNGRPPLMRSDGKLTEDIQSNPAFKAWFGNSKVVDSSGKPLIVYHGTTHDFSRFSMKGANPENYYGKGYYFTSSKLDTKNYAGFGPDLTKRIEQRAEQILDDWTNNTTAPKWNSSEAKTLFDKAKEQAKKELAGKHLGMVMSCYLRMVNPVVVKRNGGTWFEFNYDENTGKKSGSGVKLYNALLKIGDMYDLNTKKLWSDVMEKIDDPQFTALDLEQAAWNSNYAGECIELGGTNSTIAMAYRMMGFDGIILDTNVAEFSRWMDTDPNTMHYIVWKSTQIKSAIGNIGTFNKRSQSITASREYKGKVIETITVDNEKGIGYDYSIHNFIGSRGFKVLMKPSTYLSLVANLGNWAKPEYQVAMNDYLKAGNAIALPMIRFVIPKEWEQNNYSKPAVVRGHEGRHRITAILDLEGDNFTEVIVRISNEKKDIYPVAKIKPEWLRQINARCVTQDDMLNSSYRITKGPFFKMNSPMFESAKYTNPSLDYLSKQHSIAWDFIGTLIAGEESEILQKFIMDNQQITHYIISTTPNEDIHWVASNAFSKYNTGISTKYFKGLIGSTINKKWNMGAKQEYYNTFKEKTCAELHIPVLVDDDADLRTDMGKYYNITIIHPKQCVTKNIKESSDKYTKKTDFRFKKGALLMQRVGPINAQKQIHTTGNVPPVKRGMWAFPYPAMDLFFAYHKIEPTLPKECRRDYIMAQYEKVSPEEYQALWDKREKEVKKRKSVLHPKTFWWNGPIYSHISPRGMQDEDKSWYLWTDLKAWAKAANASMVAPYECFGLKPKPSERKFPTYSVDHIELFLPQSAKITKEVK